MSNTTRSGITCPKCSNTVAVNMRTGRLYPHGPRTSPCVLSNTTGPEAEVVLLREYWRIGDALAAARYAREPYPTPVIPDGLDLDQQLVFLVGDARQYIAGVYRSKSESQPA
jgi:hypothetical protein